MGITNLNGNSDEEELPSRTEMLSIALENMLDIVHEDLPNLTYGEIIGALETFKHGLLMESYERKDETDGEEWKAG